MRVIAGMAKGRKLQAPSQGVTRPTPARVREALFSTLAPYTADASVLDICAGSGALGIEALSRGAQAATFIERDPRVARVLRHNLTVLPAQVQASAHVLVGEAVRTLARLAAQNQRYGLIVCDAPFAQPELLTKVLASLVDNALLAPDGIVAIEHHGKQEPPAPPPGLRCVRHKRYGEVALATYVGYTELFSADAAR